MGWPGLQKEGPTRLALFYKVVFGLLAVPTEDILLCADSHTRASHSYKYSTIRDNTEPYRQSFIPRTIPEWNILPPSIAEAPSIDILRHALTRWQPPLAAVQSALSWRLAVSNSFPPPRFILQVDDSEYIARQARSLLDLKAYGISSIWTRIYSETGINSKPMASPLHEADTQVKQMPFLSNVIIWIFSRDDLSR